MDFWISFWTWTIYIAVSLFALLSLWVIVAGFGDIKKMFAALRAQREAEERAARGE